MEISYLVSPAEELDFAGKQFDCITACQCYWYFDNQKAAPVFARLLKPHGELLLLCMEWLPYSDKIAEASEKLVLQYNPKWSGAGETKHPISVAPELLEYFDLTYHEEYELDVSFTRTSWNGRMKACRGIGASLTPEEIAAWEKEHLQLLERIAPETFLVRHYAAIAGTAKEVNMHRIQAKNILSATNGMNLYRGAHTAASIATVVRHAIKWDTILKMWQ